MNDAQEKRLHSQIETVYRKAWCDALEQEVRKIPPNYDWIVRLYKEIRDKLTFFLKRGSAMRNEIEELMDVELFEQMIRNNAFGGCEFHKLVCYVFDTCLKLGSPARDDAVKGLKQEVLVAAGNGAVFATLVPIFFKNANTCADWIHDDLRNLKKNFNSSLNNLNK